MKIVVLGSTGYLGQRLVKQLISDPNNSVCCVHRKTSDLFCFASIKEKVEFCCSEHDLLKSYLQSNRDIDCIINAACSYMKSGENCIENIIQSNLIFPMTALAQSIENRNQDKILKYITIGTGLPNDFNIYAFTKKELNNIGLFFSKQKKVQYINVELQTFYGPGEPKTRFIPSCIDKLKNGQDLQLTIGTQCRDFVYIDDVIAAIMLVIKHNNLPDYLDLPIGSGQAPSIRQVVEYLKEITNSNARLLFGAIPSRANEPSICADLSVYEKLGGKIQYSWKDGLKKLLQEEENENFN